MRRRVFGHVIATEKQIHASLMSFLVDIIFDQTHNKYLILTRALIKNIF